MNLAFHSGLRKRKAAPKTRKDFTENTTMKRFPALVGLALYCSERRGKSAAPSAKPEGGIRFAFPPYKPWTGN
jgi:hypothetical protein